MRYGGSARDGGQRRNGSKGMGKDGKGTEREWEEDGKRNVRGKRMGRGQ
jgi:hypothetical protein